MMSFGQERVERGVEKLGDFDWRRGFAGEINSYLKAIISGSRKRKTEMDHRTPPPLGGRLEPQNHR
jgi:hypothetical protein